MEYYEVESKYLNYLRQEEKRIPAKDNRPFIGILFEIENMKYCAPLHSPKPKHEKMKNSLDFHKINGNYGVVNFNLMIPVDDAIIKKIDFLKIEDSQYRNLIQRQYKEIIMIEEILKTKSIKLYKLITTKENTLFHERCLDYKRMEILLGKYLEK